MYLIRTLFSWPLLVCLLVAAFHVACGGDGEATIVGPDTSPAPAAALTPPMPTEEASSSALSATPIPSPTLSAVPTASPTVPAATAERPPTQTRLPNPTEKPPRRPTRETATATPAPTPTRQPTVSTSPTAAPGPSIPGELNFPNPQVSGVSDDPQREPIDFDIGEATLWRDVIVKLSDDEAACFRTTLGEERYQWVLKRSALQDAPAIESRDPWAEYWQVLLWGCLEQETAVDLFWSTSESQINEVLDSMRGLLLGPQEDEEVVLVEDCLRRLLAYTDFPRFVTAGLRGKSGESRATQEYEGATVSLIIGLAFCAGPPDQSRTSPEESEGLAFLSDYDFSWRIVVEGVTGLESDCILGALPEAEELVIEEQVFDGMTAPWEVTAWGCLSRENAAHLFEASDPNLEFVFSKDKILEYGGDDIECIRESLLKVDYPRLIASSIPSSNPRDSVTYFALTTALAYCSPGKLEGFDNYVNDAIGDIRIRVGDSVSAAVDYPDDDDWYRFDAQGGRNYHIEISSDTLRLAGTALFGPDGEWLATGDDRRQSGVFEINWNAPFSGEFYFSAHSKADRTELGQYRVRVSVSAEIEDDHGDSREDATPIEVGETVQGILGYGNDTDFLSFTAIGEQTYSINVDDERGLPLRFNVYDDDGSSLGSNINRLGEPVILWLRGAGRQWPVIIGIGQHTTDRQRSLGFRLTSVPL